MPPMLDPAARGQTFKMGFPADPAKVRQALGGLIAAPPVRILGDADRGTVELVLAEVLNKIVEHADAGGTGPVEVDLWTTDHGLAFRVADSGRPMPDGTLPEGQLPDLPQTNDGLSVLADLPEGGFGWHLIRSMTQDMTYARQGGRNRLSFVIPCGG